MKNKKMKMEKVLKDLFLKSIGSIKGYDFILFVVQFMVFVLGSIGVLFYFREYDLKQAIGIYFLTILIFVFLRKFIKVSGKLIGYGTVCVFFLFMIMGFELSALLLRVGIIEKPYDSCVNVGVDIVLMYFMIEFLFILIVDFFLALTGKNVNEMKVLKYVPKFLLYRIN